MSSKPCRQAVLNSGVLELGKFEFANGNKSNNKLNLDKLFEHPAHLDLILRHLAEIAMRYEPDVLVGVPSGGQEIAIKLVDKLHIFPDLAQLKKVESKPGLKTFTYASGEDEDIIKSAKNIVVVEDVFNKFTSTRGVLAVTGILEKTQAVVGVWDRGFHPSRGFLPVPKHALVTEYIPNYLREADDIYPYGVPVTEED